MGDGRAMAGDLPAVVHSGVEKAIGIQHSTVADYVQRLRRRRPAATPAEIVSTLERRYLTAVTGAGAMVGGAAAVPGIGTGLALALSAGESVVFLEATALFTLALAEVHAVRTEEVEHRRTLVLTVALGDGGTMLVEKMAGRTGEHWGKLLADLVPMSSISAINKTLCHWAVTQHRGARGLRSIGRFAPFGVGAGLGAAGNHAFGRMVVSASRRAFGPAPASFADRTITIVGSPRPPVTSAARPEPAPQAAQPAEAQAAPPAKAQATPERPAAVPPAEASVTGKYRPLFDHLVARENDHVELGFSDIDAIVTGGLPKSAVTAKSWWANSAGSRQAKAWLAAGFAVAEVSIGSRTVRFDKRQP